MNRRDFLRASVLAGGAAVLPQTARAEAAGRPLKVCVFSDLHFTPGVYTNDTPEFLERILARAEKERCDLVIHAGDMVQNVAERPVKELLATYNGFKIPARHVIGNHEQDGTTHEETLEALQLTCGHYFFDMGGFRFVILDPNYFCNEPGKFIHSSKGNYFRRSVLSTLNWIPPDQLAWLKATLDGSPHPCVVLSHQSFERGPGGAMVRNAAEVREVFNAANARHPGRVRLVINGHLHVDHLRILDNIAYWDVNSANMYYWGGRQREYPKEYLAAHAGAPYTIGNCSETLGWKDPLSAILTLHPNGRIKIEGSRSDWLFGVTPQMAGFPEYDKSDRLIAPVIRDADITLNFA